MVVLAWGVFEHDVELAESGLDDGLLGCELFWGEGCFEVLKVPHWRSGGFSFDCDVRPEFFRI